MLTIFLTRHGHTELSEPDRYLGQRIPVALSERGRQDAQALADRLKSVFFDRVISSPLPRSHDTARIITGERKLEVELDPRMAEFDYGSWEGMTTDDVAKELPHEHALYEANPAVFHVGGGENGIQAAQRSMALIDELLAWWGGDGDRTCVLIGHSSINRALLAAVTGVPLPEYRRRFLQDWVNLTILRWESLDSGPLLVLVNDTSHVDGASPF